MALPLTPPVPHMESGAHLGVQCNHSFSHWEVTEGITVEGEESVDTKKYAVDGIPLGINGLFSSSRDSLCHSPMGKGMVASDPPMRLRLHRWDGGSEGSIIPFL